MLQVIEDNENQHAYFMFNPQPIGSEEIIDGKLMKVVNNYQTVVVTYEEVELPA